MSEKKDAELIKETLNGDPTAFDELVRRYQDRVYNVLLRLCQHPQDAEDLTQEVFIKVYDSLAEFRGESSLYTWVYRVAANAYYSRCRHLGAKKIIKTVPLRVGVSAEGDRSPGLPPSPNPGPSEVAASRETQEIVNQAITALTDENRMVIVLKHIEGMEYQQIAEVLNWPIGTVKSRLHRARQELREKLEEMPEV